MRQAEPCSAPVHRKTEHAKNLMSHRAEPMLGVGVGGSILSRRKHLIHPGGLSLSPGPHPGLAAAYRSVLSVSQGAKLILARDPAAAHGPHRRAVPRPERDAVLQCQWGRGGGGGEFLYLLRVPLPALHDDREAGARLSAPCAAPQVPPPATLHLTVFSPFSSGSSTSAGAARWPGTAAPSASRRTGLPTRSTVGRRGAPSSTSWSPSDDGPRSAAQPAPAACQALWTTGRPGLLEPRRPTRAL